MLIKARTIARWNTQRSGKEKLHYINLARRLRNEGHGDQPIDIPDTLMDRHSRIHKLHLNYGRHAK